jgi:uncharacterized linocin/CFP29 family protein
MNILRRELAPIPAEGWSLIDATAKETLAASLSARKFVDFDGPHGLAHAAVPTGRLTLVKETKGNELGYGLHQVLPLAETRVHFDLSIWELDNLIRGAKDIALDGLVQACRTAAAFEESAVFDGLEAAGITGLHQAAPGNPIALALECNAAADAVGEAQGRLLKAGVGGPAHLVVNPALCKFLNHSIPGGSLGQLIAQQIGGSVITSAAVKDALLVSARGGDLELSVGQDFAIGYRSHTTTTVNLFLTESFTFRVIAAEALVKFVVK